MRRHIDLPSDVNGQTHALVDFGPSKPVRLIPTRAFHATAPSRGLRAPGLGVGYGHTWRSSTGRLYHFSTSVLRACRAPARAVYVLVRRDDAGHAVGQFVGAAVSRAPTLNLARIRERAAILGATEVHLLDITHTVGSYAARRLVRDLRAGLEHAAV